MASGDPLVRSADQTLRVIRTGKSKELLRGNQDSRIKAPQFLAFCDQEGNPTLSAELVASYRVSLVREGKSSPTVGVHLAAIKALTRAAVMAGLMLAEVAAAINDVKGAPRRGNRIGNRLTREQARELLSLPDRESLKGKRDYAIPALLLGCGLRRMELVLEVMVGAIAQRENRWVLVDITGKGNRVRSVAVPAWVKAAIDARTTAAGITAGKIFRAVHKGGKVWGEDASCTRRPFDVWAVRRVSWFPTTSAKPCCLLTSTIRV